MNIIEQLRKIIEEIKKGINSIRYLILDRGIAPLKIPIIEVFGVYLICYMGIYSPLDSGLKKAVKKLETLKAKSQYASVFDMYKGQIDAWLRKLPPYKSKETWLADVIIMSARVEDIQYSMAQPVETTSDDFVYMSIQVTAVLPYKKAALWIARIENSPFYAQISDCSIKKSDKQLGHAEINIKVSTMFSKT